MTTGGPERFAELTALHFGERLSMQQAWQRTESVLLDDPPVGDRVWVGSIGYERYRDNVRFAQVLADAGVQRLIDVRELPISRKRGFAKTALSQACSAAGVEYMHLRELGNPKPIRDIYKAGQVEEGRELYEAFLTQERLDAVTHLSELLTEMPTALMCVEHDSSTCHRTVILEALAASHIDLEVAEL